MKKLISVFQIAIIFCLLSSWSDLKAQANWGIFARFRFGDGVKFVKAN